MLSISKYLVIGQVHTSQPKNVPSRMYIKPGIAFLSDTLTLSNISRYGLLKLTKFLLLTSQSSINQAKVLNYLLSI